MFVFLAIVLFSAPSDARAQVSVQVFTNTDGDTVLVRNEDRGSNAGQLDSLDSRGNTSEARFDEAVFHGVGAPFPHVQSVAAAASADGSVVIGTSAAEDGIEEAFRWDTFTIERLGTLPGGTESSGRDISTDRSGVVGLSYLSNDPSDFQAFRWTEDEGMEGLGYLHSGKAWSEALAVSADGSVIVGDASSENGIVEAFRWTEAGGIEGLGDLPGGSFNSNAFDVSSDGSVIVGASESDDGDEAFHWTEEEGMQTILTVGTNQIASVARATSAEGSVIVGRITYEEPARSEAFRWEPGDVEDLGDLPGGDRFSEALDVSPDGSIVVGESCTGGCTGPGSRDGFEAFIWTDSHHDIRSMKSVMEDGYGLDLTGWTLHSAEHISFSNRGITTIVGTATNPDGNLEGWRVALPRFPGVGDLPGEDFLSEALGASADGSVVVGRGLSDEAKGSEGFRFEDGSIEGLGGLSENIESDARAVSADGSVVVGESQAASGIGNEAFRWTEGAGMVGLGDLPGGSDWPSSEARAVSADGTVVVGRGESEDGFEAFRWTDGEMIGLGDFPDGGFDSEANGVSSDGSVVVGKSLSERGFEAFRWTENSGMVDLGDLPGGNFSSTANAVSGDGSVVVGGSSSEKGFEAFRWTEDGGMVGLGDLPGDDFSSTANAVSDDGSVVVGKSDTDNGFPFGTEAFVWTEEAGMQNLTELVQKEYEDAMNGWVFAEATDVSIAEGDTVIVTGIGLNPLGLQEGFHIPLTEIVPVADRAAPKAPVNNLNAPSPNPVRITSVFIAAAERGQHVSVETYDAPDSCMQALYDGILVTGTSETLTLDASVLSEGVYLVRATSEDFTKKQRIAVIR